MKQRPIGKSMWNLTGEYFCLLKEKDLYKPYQMENINSGFFCFSFFDISTNSFIVYSATTLSKRARRQ